MNSTLPPSPSGLAVCKSSPPDSPRQLTRSSAIATSPETSRSPAAPPRQKDIIGLNATAAADLIDVNQTDATHFTYRQNLFIQGFAFSNVFDAKINSLAGDDLIRISVTDTLETTTPGAALRFDVDGGSPNASDRLIVNDDGLGDLILWRQADDNHSGSITVGAFAPVVYNNIERVDITPIDAITGGTGTDMAGRIKVFHTDPYEYNDTLPNSAQLQRIGAIPTSPNIDPAGIPGFNLPGDNDFYVFRPQATGTYPGRHSLQDPGHFVQWATRLARQRRPVARYLRCQRRADHQRHRQPRWQR